MCRWSPVQSSSSSVTSRLSRGRYAGGYRSEWDASKRRRRRRGGGGTTRTVSGTRTADVAGAPVAAAPTACTSKTIAPRTRPSKAAAPGSTCSATPIVPPHGHSLRLCSKATPRRAPSASEAGSNLGGREKLPTNESALTTVRFASSGSAPNQSGCAHNGHRYSLPASAAAGAAAPSAAQPARSSSGGITVAAGT